MNVRMPPRFGIWAVAGVAMVAIQRTAPRPAAATPDLLIMASLLLLSRMDRCTNPGIICGEASVGAELVALGESNTPRCRPLSKIAPQTQFVPAAIYSSATAPRTPFPLGRC